MTAGRSAALVRRWVALYTVGLPRDLRDTRRAEIEDDLWSQAHDELVHATGSGARATCSAAWSLACGPTSPGGSSSGTAIESAQCRGVSR